MWIILFFVFTKRVRAYVFVYVALDVISFRFIVYLRKDKGNYTHDVVDIFFFLILH